MSIPKIKTSFTTFDVGTIRKEKIETPFGALTHTWEYRPGSGAPFESEHWWKDFRSEFQAIRYWLEGTEVHLDAELWGQRLDRVGDDGIIPIILLPTPLKQFHWLAGQEKSPSPKTPYNNLLAFRDAAWKYGRL